MDALTHPAVDVAVRRVSEHDAPASAVGAVVLGDAVAVLVDAQMARYVVFMDHSEGSWVAPDFLCGTARVSATRAAETVDHWPLSPSSRSGGSSASGRRWYALSGTAAEDAVTVSVVSELGRADVPVGADGLVFAVVPVRDGEKPHVVVHTRDGRAVPARAGWL
ncbi:hypothetical protein [Nocardia anaemiae]|uniref:hypothetical protein n=1 Tax=Nocardia anaemiae TaxID=263910 RepID=UPI0007A547DF|nr:hypothetical protein [Nocardia anaemiae]